MAASTQPSLQQQLAEVEEAAEKAEHPVLVQAAFMGRHDVLAHLLRTAGDGMGQEECSGAFLAAACGGHEQCLRVLLEALASQSATAELLGATSPGGASALMWAAARGFASCVRLLLQHSPDAQVTHRCSAGWNALAAASVGGHAECAALLLQHCPGAQVAAVTGSGYTAAVIAAEGGKLACLQLVLQHSPQQQRLDKALVFAAREWGRQQQRQPDGGAAADKPLKPYQRCVELLLSKGAMLTAEAPDSAFALVRPVIQDLAARALVPDMAKEAAVQAVQRGASAESEQPHAHLATAVVSDAADKQQPAATEAGGKREQQGRKRGRASRGSDTSGSISRQRK